MTDQMLAPPPNRAVDATHRRTVPGAVVAGGVLVLMLHNVGVARGISEVATLVVNLAFTASLLGLAWWSGFSRAELGLARGRGGWTPAAIAGAITALAVLVVAAVVPITGPLRRWSGGLAASVAVHASANVTVFAVVLVGRGGVS